MRKYWKRFGELATVSRLRPFRNTELKLTALYVLNTMVVLVVFLTILGYFRIQYLRSDLAGNLAPGVDSEALVQSIYIDLQTATAVLAVFVLLAMAVLSYVFVKVALRPIKEFTEAQRRFISDASHELRTPLATMRTENEVALMDSSRLTREEAVEIIQSNMEEADRIATILNNLLNLASFNNATGTPKFASVDLSAVATLAISRLDPLAERKRIKIVASNLSPARVWGNATAVEEIVSNLLKNAIQYTPVDGQIFLETRSRTEDRQGELIVRDTGIGISPEDLPYIFEPFYRSDKSLHMYQQGNGLGLAMVREIVKRHDGSINVQSERGHGTTVTVSIPAAPRP